MMPEQTPSSPKKQLTLSLDYRIISIALLVVIVAMLALWRPWTTTKTDRTVQVTGQATVTAVPDEFVFYPTYEVANADRQTALTALAKKSDEVVAGLRAVGVPENKIKTNSDGYDSPRPLTDDASSTPTYFLRLTVTANSKDQAQKVQDYIVATSPTGAVSPQAQFSESKRRELESKARDEATKDARAKAEQSAKNLDFRVGAVKSVNDGAGFDGGIGISYPAAAQGATELKAVDSSNLAVQPGENELRYTVAVTYFVR
jgi:uncharacterized protein YggE